jgi:hypothetical protein
LFKDFSLWILAETQAVLGRMSVVMEILLPEGERTQERVFFVYGSSGARNKSLHLDHVMKRSDSPFQNR